MRSFYYRSGRNAFLALFLGLLAVGVGMLWIDEGGFILLAFSALMAAGATKAGFDAMSREPALKFDQHAIWVRKTWGGLEEVPWRDVHDISATVLTTRYMGIIPVGRTAYITVACEGGTFGARRLRVSTTAMGLSLDQSADLVATLKQTQVAAVGLAGAAMAGAGSRGWGVDTARASEGQQTGSGIDADAAIARYLAAKEREAQAVPPTAATQPAMPQRPVFGRRVS